MRLTVRLEPSRLRRWHLHLVERLALRPRTRVAVAWERGGAELPSAVALLFGLEKLVYRLAGPCPTDAASPEDFTAFGATDAEGADLVIDLSGTDAPARAPTWRVTFDGVAHEAAALGALAAGRMPVIAVVEGAGGHPIASGLPGTDNRNILVLAFEDLLARTALLITAALDGAAAQFVGQAPQPVTADSATISRFAIRSLAGAIAMRLYRLCYWAPHWRVGWRFVDGAGDIIDLGALPNGWHDLPDDGRRFYADPFPVEHDGRMHLFVEDFDHRLGRGVISAVQFDATGPIGAPRTVLDPGCHSSYPFVFAYHGEIWMVPETCAAATVDLYRATAYPDRWVKEATLLSGIVASDATLFEHDGRWWMLATVRGETGSYSDVLHAWSADQPAGPWRPHRRNPLLVDIASARPAGHVVRRGGNLIRPVQDCRDGYGTALGLARITRLDDDGFAQSVHTVLRPGPAWPGRRLHTLNRTGRLECIDGSKSLRRF